MVLLDVWIGKLNLDEKALEVFADYLDEHERVKAEKFRFLALRNRYIAVRGMLRQLLAEYLGVKPAALTFEVGEYGKPVLKCASLYFNLSHSADALAIVVSEQSDIGVDIELINPAKNLSAIAERCFSADEFAYWLKLPDVDKARIFYRLWTAKEAFVKAVGRGIALGLEQCILSVPDVDRFLAIPAGFGALSDWQIFALQVPEDMCGALVTPRNDYRLKQFCLNTKKPL